jgi:serralysin
MLLGRLRDLLFVSAKPNAGKQPTPARLAIGLLSTACLVSATSPVPNKGVSSAGHPGYCSYEQAAFNSTAVQSGKAFCAIPPITPKQAAAARALQIVAVPQFPLADTFKLHSRRTASKTVFLDFDGHATTGTPWNTGGNTITTGVYSFEGDSSFSDNELTQIQEIWQRVAECFSPFDVNVTTEAPPVEDLINRGTSDTRWGIRVTIGDSTPDPAPQAGGVAYLGSFTWDTDTPTFVFTSRLGNFGKYIADATIHEVGHTLGLSHDGRTTPVEGYYQGHGSGVTAWAPHMGVGYGVNLVQWSKGEYTNADNPEDDLAIIVDPIDNGWSGPNGFGYRPDDASNTSQTAANIGGTAAAGVFNIAQKGVIEKRADVDWYKITAGTGSINVTATGGPENSMLDINLELYNSGGTLLASSQPVNQLTATVSRTVSAGTYYVKVEGVARTGTGTGNPPDEGYSDYGSLGQYSLTGTCVNTSGTPGGNVVASYNSTTKKLTLTGDTGANTVKVTFVPNSPGSATGKVRVEGVGLTKINNKTTPAEFNHSGKLDLGAALSGGDDSIYVTNIYASNLYLNMGAGADQIGLSMCFIEKMNVDGGPGVDALISPGTTLPPVGPKRVIRNVP